MGKIAFGICERFGVWGAAGLLLFLVGWVVAIRVYHAGLMRATRPGSLARIRGQVCEFRAMVGLLGIPIVVYCASVQGASPQLFWAIGVFSLYAWAGARLWVRFIQPGTAAPRPTAIYFCLVSQAYWFLSFVGFWVWRDGWRAATGGSLASMAGFLAVMAVAVTVELRKHSRSSTHPAEAGPAETGAE